MVLAFVLFTIFYITMTKYQNKSDFMNSIWYTNWKWVYNTQININLIFSKKFVTSVCDQKPKVNNQSIYLFTFFKSCYLKREDAAWRDLFKNQNVEWSSVNTPFVMFWGTIYDCQWSFEEKKKQIKSGKINGKEGAWGSEGQGGSALLPGLIYSIGGSR